MAEDEDGVSDKKSPENSNNGDPSQENESSTSRPDLGIEETKYNSSEDSGAPSAEAKSSSSKGGGTRKEENPFSLRHFLKRDLSLPGTSTYESTGARPKVYASTVQHSPTREPSEPRRERPRPAPTPDTIPNDCSVPNVSSSSSVEIPFSVVDNTDSKHNFYSESNEPFFHRPNLASEPLGMPSLPDFVQDHILVEQAYLNPNGPISVDLDNLPDFTFNTNFNAGSSSSLGRRNNAYGSNYDYDSYLSASNERQDGRDVPAGVEVAGAVPLDIGAHLSLDLTESVNPADRRNMSPRSTFPLDLPPNAGAESMRLPDFLPVHPGRTSPEPEHQDDQLQQIMAELERTRSEVFTERSRRRRAEEELRRLRAALTHEDHAGAADAESSIIAELRKEIKQLKEELSIARAEVRGHRTRATSAARGLRRAADVADTSLRELLAGLEQLKSLSTTLDPT